MIPLLPVDFNLGSLFWQDRVVVAVLLSLIAALSYAHLTRKSSVVDNALKPPQNVKSGRRELQQTEREWGSWTPVTFAYPTITPCLENLADMKPIPYRPFKWGPYHITMGIRDMPWDEWIELDHQMLSYYRIRKHRIDTQGVNVLRVMPDSADGIVKSASHAAIELLHEVSDYLGKRYPSAYTVSRNMKGHITSVTFLPVKETFDLPPPLPHEGSTELREVGIEEAEYALRVSALIAPDDFALMLEGTDGRYYFQGGAICIPGFWRMRDKIGKSLEDIHIEGNVPQYPTKLQTSMGRFFKRMPVDKPVIRNNYSFQVIQPDPQRQATLNENVDLLIDPEELAWSTTINGSEDTFVHGQRYPDGSEPLVAPETMRLRSERQTLRRLPLSGAIVFGIRTYTFAVEDLAKEPGVAARMASAIRSWPDDVVKYKGRKLYEHVVLELLDKAADKQRVEGDEDLMKEGGRGYPY